MGATKDSPANQLLEWAVTKLDEASKTDWVEKFSALASSKPAYLRNGVLTPGGSRPASGTGGVSQAAYDAALARAQAAEAKVAALTVRVADLEAQLGPSPAPAAPAADGEVPAEEHHKSHWWSRH
ncbi:MAG TPA: hypothetical protein VHL53_00790 [Acidimicrobiia bacterium]|nr:hypothetical protein [Acidimicrobiia bacterium]